MRPTKKTIALQVTIPIAVILIVAGTFAFVTRNDTRETGGKTEAKKEKTIAENFGVKKGVVSSSYQNSLMSISYNSLWRATGSNKLDSIQLDPYGKAELIFRDQSIATSTFPPESVQSLAERARKNGSLVSVSPIQNNEPSPWWMQLIIPLIIVGGIVGFIFFLRKNQMEENTKKETTKVPLVRETFKNVAGCDEAVEEVREFVLFLKERERFLKLGAKMPSGAILHGPPGTGKTLLARALAGEAGVPFYAMAGSEAVNKYVGVGASTVRNLFKKARSSESGAVIFIDEIDALGRKRSGDGEPSSREHDATLNQLLVELDGFSGREKIIVIGATNRIDTLDPALLRPGRLSRHIPVLAPNEKGREEILRMYARDKPLAKDVDLKALAHITAGSTGADLSHILNEAAIQAARHGRETISEADLREGHLRALAGPERPGHIIDQEELRAIAYHEAGHVLCGEMCPDHERAERVTIVARGQAAGMAVWGAEDRALHSPEYVRQRMIGILGGRAAEKVAIGNISSGAANDLQQANELARTAIEDWGISKTTGQLISRSGHHVSDETRSLVDREVEEMVADAFRDAITLLEANRTALNSLADALQKNKVLERVDILAAISGKTVEFDPDNTETNNEKRSLEVDDNTEKISSKPYVRRIRKAIAWVEALLPEDKEKVSS